MFLKEMIMKKRKRKHHSDDSSEGRASDDEKYIAYVKKSNKKDKKRSKSSSVASGAAVEKSSVKKSKKKKRLSSKSALPEELEACDTASNASTVSLVSIVAKPKINKAALELNSAIKAEDDDFKLKVSSSKHKKSKSKKYKAPESPESSRVDFIVPKLDAPSKFDMMSEDNESLEIELSAADSWAVENLNMDSSVEDNSEKSCVPQVVKDYKNTSVDEDHQDTLKVNKSKSKEKSKSTTDTHVDKSEEHLLEDVYKESKSASSENSNIPLVLQEFYEEITRNFEQRKSDKKRKKKTSLTVDNSVKDSNNLTDIVSNNTALLDKSSPTNQMAQFFSLESKVILVLRPKTQFSFLGKLKIKVLYGAIKLYGSVFHPQNTVEPIEIYSSRGYSSITISTVNFDGTYNKEALWDALISNGVDRSLKTKLHDSISECKSEWSVLLLENFENTLTNFLSNHCTFKLFPKIENTKYSWCDPKRAECVLQANFQFYSSSDEISISPQWNEKVTRQLINQWNHHKRLSAMIVGGKGVGKSTTARYLINNLITHSERVVLLDLDPGQAEMTPAACLSLNIIDKPLLGPNFTHLKEPIHQVYLEDINVSNCITRYIECIKKLVESYRNRKDLNQYPLIINTMGFCKGIGLDICIYLIKLIEPTNVIQILSKRAKNNYDFALLQQTVNERKTFTISLDGDSQVFQKNCNYELHYVPTLAEGKRQFDTWNMEPRQQRELVLLSYLSQIISNAEDKCFCSVTSNNINNIIPYELPFSSFYISLTKSSTSPSHILAAMNGNLVALCGLDSEDETPEKDRESLKYPMVIIKPPATTCYGYGIVRGVDMAKRLLYINTPVSEQHLRHVNLLAGCVCLPFTLLHSVATLDRQQAPYAGDRGELPTSREARRGYFRRDQSKST